MWLRSNFNYTEEELNIILHALFSYLVDLKGVSEEYLSVSKLLNKISKEYEFLVNNNT